MAGVLSQLEAFVKNNWCALLVGALVMYYVYYSRGRSGLTIGQIARGEVRKAQAAAAKETAAAMKSVNQVEKKNHWSLSSQQGTQW